MSSTTTHTCDKCGHSQDAVLLREDKDYRDFFTVGVIIVPHVLDISKTGAVNLDMRSYPAQCAHWCRKCCIKTGLVKAEKHSTETLETKRPLITLESMVKELAREEVITYHEE